MKTRTTTKTTQQLPPRRVDLPSKVKVDEYMITVSIPLSRPIVIINNLSVSDAEKFFNKRRDNETDASMQKEFERAALLLKWAGCWDATLVEMHNETRQHQLKITLSFTEKRDFTEFERNLLDTVQ